MVGLLALLEPILWALFGPGHEPRAELTVLGDINPKRRLHAAAPPPVS